MQVPFHEVDDLELHGLWLSCIYPKIFLQAKQLAARKLNISPDSIQAHCFATGYVDGLLADNHHNQHRK